VDITERLTLEAQLRHSQKLESIGQLAAGVAHDFNNILMIIQSHISLRLGTPNLDGTMAESLRQMSSASERAANLTRQLLAFSAKQMVQPKVLNLNQTIRQLQALLHRAIGEQISMECEFDESLPAVEADECSMEQVIMNLVVNARDAMPNGGQLILRTKAVQVDAAHAEKNPDARPGQYVCCSVIDQGCGIDPAVLDRIFEPFFTTKEFGKGTGLGLATAFGIIKQHGGWIEVQSQVGRGSSFSVYLPRSEKIVPLTVEPAACAQNLQGRERILLVEDEPLLRELLRELLEQNGYGVVEASDGVEALERWQREGGRFDVLVTDIVMPNGMNGLELGQKLRQAKARLRLIYTSGYNSEMAGKDFAPEEGTAFLQKPYKPEALLQAIRDALEGRSDAAMLGEDALAPVAAAG